MTREQCQAEMGGQVPGALRDVRRFWVMTFSGLALTLLLVLVGYGLVDLQPMHHLEYLTVLVNCGGGLETHAALAEQQHVHPSAVCLDRMDSVATARSTSNCSTASGGDCGRASGQSKQEEQNDPDALRRWRL